jgi:hypothetical protein
MNILGRLVLPTSMIRSVVYMHNNIFETFLKICGTERLAATLLGITQPHISQIRNGFRSLNFEKAILLHFQ